jgi:FtsP/CotA-like multicopper oxidase with cupredoxin domain
MRIAKCSYVCTCSVMLLVVGCGEGQMEERADIGDLSNPVSDEPTLVPLTPDVDDLPSSIIAGAREFHVTAEVFNQQLETTPLRTAEVWGYNGNTPGPTAIAYEGEKIRFVVTNALPEPTTVHFHGMHEPNEADGVPGISQPEPIAPGETYTYEFTPGHTGVFAYHSHTNDAKQELKGLAGFFVILPEREKQLEQVDAHYLFVLQEFFFSEDGQPVDTEPPGGDFNTFTINGKTLDAASVLEANVGDRIRISLYNASQDVHSMHQHGADLVVTGRNGHPRAAVAQEVVTTFDLGPGNFVDLEFSPDKPGLWLFHCHFPHHTSNQMQSGPEGSPLGMSRIFDVSE